jgi:hypothetical protein
MLFIQRIFRSWRFTIAKHLGAFKANRWIHEKIHSFFMFVFLLCLFGILMIPSILCTWIVVSSLCVLEWVLKELFQPKIFARVPSKSSQGPFVGHTRGKRFFSLPELYVANTGYYGKDNNPIRGLYAGEYIKKRRWFE